VAAAGTSQRIAETKIKSHYDSILRARLQKDLLVDQSLQPKFV